MNQKYFNINQEHLSVRCKLYAADHARTFEHVAIATYGFGGDKDNHPVQKFAERLTSKYKGYAVVTFDWPAHGTDGRKRLSIPESMEYLTLVVNYAREQLEAQHLYYYGTSYGGYVALRYLVEVGDPFDKIALRCPGIDLYRIMSEHLTDDEKHKISRGKKVLIGYERKSEIDQEFLDDLKAHDVRAYEYFDWADDMLLIHGVKDAVVPIEDTRRFADDNVIPLIEVPDGDHPFSNPHAMDYAIGEIVKFFGV